MIRRIGIDYRVKYTVDRWTYQTDATASYRRYTRKIRGLVSPFQVWPMRAPGKQAHQVVAIR